MKRVIIFLTVSAVCAVMFFGFSEMVRLRWPGVADLMLSVAGITALAIGWQAAKRRDVRQ